MVHVGGSGDYPAAQLEALDALIAYIDAYYGNESQIIDHKAWRSGNSDTSPEFATYLENYQNRRKHAQAFCLRRPLPWCKCINNKCQLQVTYSLIRLPDN